MDTLRGTSDCMKLRPNQSRQKCKSALTPMKHKINRISRAKKFSKEMIKNYANKRVILRNLVYVINLPATLAEDELGYSQILCDSQYFGQYGQIVKCKVKKDVPQQPENEVTFSAHITYTTEEEASMCIRACDKFELYGNVLAVTFGTTKYCSYFLKEGKCPKKECPFLHEFYNEMDTLTKENITQCKYVTPVNPQYLEAKIKILPADGIISQLPAVVQVQGRHYSNPIIKDPIAQPIQRRKSIDLGNLRPTSRWQFANETDEHPGEVQSDIQELISKGLPSKGVTELTVGTIQSLLRSNEWMLEFFKITKAGRVITSQALIDEKFPAHEMVKVVPKQI